jgi:hypothetical protein
MQQWRQESSSVLNNHMKTMQIIKGAHINRTIFNLEQIIRALPIVGNLGPLIFKNHAHLLHK